MREQINQLIEKTNSRLFGTRIEKRGNRLCIRANFPVRPDGSKSDRLSLGYFCNLENLRRAEAIARKISAQLDLDEFDWSEYQQFLKLPSMPKAEKLILPCGEWVRRFEIDYFQRRKLSNKTKTTYQGDYYSVFKNLPQSKFLTPELLLDTVLNNSEPDTRTRRRYCIALGALAKFAGIGIDLKRYAGNYGIKSVSPRIIPTDTEIAEFFYKIDSPAYRWVYGMVATFGLRNYEPLRINFSAFLQDPQILEISELSKTGERLVSPYYPEWVEIFELKNICFPDWNLDRANRELGGELSRHFHKIKMPFTLLSLRHAWAIRTIQFGVDVALAARMQGHSVDVHTRYYHHWFSRQHQLEAHKRYLSQPSRPLPPSLK